MNNQLASIIYHKIMSIMKNTLELEEFSYREKGRNDPRYKTFKKHLMSNTYENTRQLLDEIETLGVIQKTDYPEDVKDGYKDTPSGGSGYINHPDFEEWVNSGYEEDEGQEQV